jgi:hypothetical protein
MEPAIREGSKGDTIRLCEQIFAVSVTFDAMTTVRPLPGLNTYRVGREGNPV